MIFVQNNDEETVAILSNDSPDACPFYNDRLIERLDDAYLAYEFYIPATHEDATYINNDEGGWLIRKGLDDNLLLFEIIRVEEVRDESGLYKYVYAEYGWQELNAAPIRPNTYTAQSAEAALNDALIDTRWQVGTVDWFGTADFVIDGHQTALKFVHEIKDEFGGELVFRVERTNGKISGRYVDLIERRGEDAGKTFTYEKDLLGVKRIHDKATVRTAMIGVGKGDANRDAVDFSDEVWSVANGDPVDKPAGQDWVGDPDALEQWGLRDQSGQQLHLYGKFEYNTEQPGVLLQKTWEHLQKVKNGILNYEVDVALLENVEGYGNEKVRIGDTVLVQDLTFEPALMVEARILEMKRSFVDPSKDKVVLGQFLPVASNADAALQELQSTLLKNETVWATDTDQIYKGDTAPGTPSKNQMWLDTSQTPAVLKYYDGSQWVKSTPTNPGEVGAEAIVHKGTSAPSNTAQLWLDTSTNPNVWKQYNGTDWIRATPVNAGEVGAEIETHKGTTAPADTSKLWIDTNQTPNVLKRHDGSAWVKVTPTAANEIKYADLSTLESLKPAAAGADVTGDNTANDTANVNGKPSTEVTSELQQALDDAAAAQQTADSKITSFYQSTEPTTGKEGDLWYDTDNGNTVYQYRNGAWVNAQDSDIGTALNRADDAQATADKKVQTYFSTTAPTAESVGDLWYNSSTSELKRWNGTDWSLKVSDVTADHTSNDTANVNGRPSSDVTADIDQALQDAANAQDTADGKITSFYQAGAPTSASEGDLWFDTDDGNTVYVYRSGSWVNAQDSEIATALNRADDAQATADKKVQTYFSSTTPTAESVGDLWYNTSTYDFKRWDGSSWNLVSDITGQKTAADTSNVNGTPASTVDSNASSGKAAKDKLDQDVGTGTVESTTGAQNKANTAEANAKDYVDVTDLGDGYKVYNNRAGYNVSGSSQQGAFVIHTPMTMSNYMTRVVIDGYLYEGNTDIDLVIGFYAYSGGTGSPSFTRDGYVTKGDREIGRVRLAEDASGQVVIIIEDTTTTWSYPKLDLVKVQIGHGSPPDSYKDGWSINLETDLSVYTNITEVPKRTLEDTTGSQNKADAAEQNAKDAVANGNVDLPADKLQGAIDTAKNTIQADSNFYWQGGTLIAIDPSNTNNVVKISSGGIGVSTDGGTTYKNAMTGAGVLADAVVANTLSAISANLGTVTAGSLTSNTTIDVGTDVSVGRYLDLNTAAGTENGIRFNKGTSVNAEIYSRDNDMLYIYGADGVQILAPDSGDSIILGNPVGGSPYIDAYGITRVHQELKVLGLTTGEEYTIPQDGIPTTTMEETGWAGLGGQPAGITTAAVLEGINFRTKKTYVPSSISYTTTTGNRTPFFTDISVDGFSVYLEGEGSTGGFIYWRGTYTA